MTAPGTARVHIIDDEDTIRDSLEFLLASRGIAATGWPSGEAYLAALPQPDCACIILDVRMGGLSGPEVFDHLLALGRTPPVIFLTGHADVPVAVQTLKAGAFDFVEKPFNDNQIVDLVQKAMASYQIELQRADERQDLDRRLAALSAREAEVMRLMLQGNLNKQIGDQLGIAMRTVEVHRSRVMAKLGARNIAELAAIVNG